MVKFLHPRFVCVCGMSEVSTETTLVDVQADSKQTCVIDMSNGSSKCNWTGQCDGGTSVKVVRFWLLV